MKNNESKEEASEHGMKINFIEREIISGEDTPFVDGITPYDKTMLMDDVEYWHGRDGVWNDNRLFDIEPCPEMVLRLQREFLN